jgi:magnesium chelatase subunit H
MLDEQNMKMDIKPYKFVILTLDSHAAGPAERVGKRLSLDFPGLEMSIHAAAEWGENPSALSAAKSAVDGADFIVSTLLFLEEHIQAILPNLKDKRESLDAFVGCVSSKEIVSLTKMGSLDMGKPSKGFLSLLKKLRGSGKAKASSGGEKQMAMLRRLPKILKFLPGKAQDLRAYFLSMQYWLGGSDENIESMVRYLLNRYGSISSQSKLEAKPPVEYPETGVYHPDVAERIFTDQKKIPPVTNEIGTVGVLLMRSYALAGDTAHYDAVIRKLSADGMKVLPVFSSGLDGRPAIEKYFKPNGKLVVDVVVSLTGFSLVGGPAYNDSKGAEEILTDLNVPYVGAHALEFQTLDQWQESEGGLGPVESTMLVALPELDGAVAPTVFGGRLGSGQEMVPCNERVDRLSSKVKKLVNLRKVATKDRKVGIILYGFPPNAGAIGSAAYLGVYESLFNTLNALKIEGYDLEPPKSVDELRDSLLKGNSEKFGQEANVHIKIPADDIVSREPFLDEIEATWGSAPGRQQSDGSGIFVLGVRYGNVFIGVQPAFGYEGDPMRLLFEKGFAPTHAFSTFYRYLREDFKANAFLHFGMHGALEFMPGKKAGMSKTCWPDRLIGDTPNIYLYAANNPSEACLAKRRANAIIISHLTPPLAQAGLYKGLLDLKESLNRWRGIKGEDSSKSDLEKLIRDQAEAVDLEISGSFDDLWLKLYETEQALIPDGLHVLGNPISDQAHSEYMEVIPGLDNEASRSRVSALLKKDSEIPAILSALEGKYIAPVPGGDLIRSPEILPTGRNMHAFDPFRMPTTFAIEEGRRQTNTLLEAHKKIPRSVAIVLWGSDNIKTDGGSISQAMSLMGAKPMFDDYGRLSGAELIPLEELGRPRIDALMTLSGIFRDLLPLQIRMLADAAFKAASADEPLDMNFVRAHSLEIVEKMGVDIEVAALRVFSNAEGAYGSNVNQLIDSAAWDQEDELADAYESRKSFAYGRDGKCSKNSKLLQHVLEKVDLSYQNLESVELGVTTVDHYFDTLGGISRAVKRAKGTEAPVYIGDQTRGGSKVRTLADQIALETRSRSLNPRWFEPLLNHGYEGVRQIEAQVTNTLGWSATTGQVEPWVYGKLSETFVLDDKMRRRMADLNPAASLRVANRLVEAHDRAYWSPDEETLEALRESVMELEDRLEGIEVAAE